MILINVPATLQKLGMNPDLYTVSVDDCEDYYRFVMSVHTNQESFAIDLMPSQVEGEEFRDESMLQRQFLLASLEEQEEMLQIPGVQELIDSIDADFVLDVWHEHRHTMAKATESALIKLFLEQTRDMSPLQFIRDYLSNDLAEYLDANEAELRD